jgi:hypothetical protein
LGLARRKTMPESFSNPSPLGEMQALIVIREFCRDEGWKLSIAFGEDGVTISNHDSRHYLAGWEAEASC